jgi:hypothetical protein
MDYQVERAEVDQHELSTGCYKGSEILPFLPTAGRRAARLHLRALD